MNKVLLAILGVSLIGCSTLKSNPQQEATQQKLELRLDRLEVKTRCHGLTLLALLFMKQAEANPDALQDPEVALLLMGQMTAIESERQVVCTRADEFDRQEQEEKKQVQPNTQKDRELIVQ